jgi:hypothetical protein
MALTKTIVEPSWEAKYSYSPAVLAAKAESRAASSSQLSARRSIVPCDQWSACPMGESFRCISCLRCHLGRFELARRR